MKWLAVLLGRRALKRLAQRKSPKVELAGGTALAAAITGLLMLICEPETAALIGPNLGALASTLVNLMFGDDVDGTS